MKSATEYLEASAAKYPEKTAVICEDSRLTYGELAEMSARVGTFIDKNDKSASPVGIFAQKSCSVIAAFLGAAYAGRAYSYLNEQLPDERLVKIADTLGSGLILADSDRFSRACRLFGDEKVRLISHAAREEADYCRLREIRARLGGDEPLYINFTSGSTGVPKGVTVSNANVIAFTDCFCETFSLAESDVAANQAPLDFDVSVKDIYSSLKTGGTLLLIPAPYFMQPTRLMDYLEENGATLMIWAVSALVLLLTFHALEYKAPQTIRRVFFSGEVMLPKHLAKLSRLLPQARLCNLYGPTEITCNCTYHEIEQGRDYSAGIPIGRALGCSDVFLLGDNGETVSESGVEGEICVGGKCVSLGYYASHELTARSFVADVRNTGGRIYKTGDIAYYNENNELMFVGRRDFQIKHLGHRIELTEIELAAIGLDGVESCCCLFLKKRGRIALAYTGGADEQELIKYLAVKLPPFMQPSVIRRLDALPLNKNGKTDRQLIETELTK